jgi:hypothetical protein
MTALFQKPSNNEAFERSRRFENTSCTEPLLLPQMLCDEPSPPTEFILHDAWNCKSAGPAGDYSFLETPEVSHSISQGRAKIMTGQAQRSESANDSSVISQNSK